MSNYISSPLKIAQFITHDILSALTYEFGLSPFGAQPNYPLTKSNQIMKAMIILWILPYLAGAIDYTLDYTPRQKSSNLNSFTYKNIMLKISENQKTDNIF